MFFCDFANYNAFLEKYSERFSNCKYTFYKNKCIAIVKNLFYHDSVRAEDVSFLEKQSGYSFEDWKSFISEFRHETEIQNEKLFEEQPMDPNNMPFAP